MSDVISRKADGTIVERKDEKKTSGSGEKK